MIKASSLAVFVLSFIITLFLVKEKEQEFGTETLSSNDESYSTSIEYLLTKLPNSNFKQALIEYVGFLTDIDGNANTSIESRMQNVLDHNRCIALLAGELNLRITKQHLLSLSQLGKYMARPLSIRPSMADWAGESLGELFRAGWLYNSALEISQGNSNLAVKLIGFCGHDDAIMSKPYLNRKLSRDLILRRNELFQSVNLGDPSGNLQSFTYMTPYYKKISAGGIFQFDCTRDSPMYLSKSLGEEVDITDAFKKRIVETQAKGNAQLLPSKYYHVLGAAALNCEVANRGASLNPTIQGLSAIAYRGIRMCSTLEEFKEKNLENLAITDRDQNKKFWLEELKYYLGNSECLNNGGLNRCNIFRNNFKKIIVRLAQRPDIDREILFSDMNTIFAKFDAARLWNKIFMRLNFDKLGQVCIPFRTLDPRKSIFNTFENVLYYVKSRGRSSLCIPEWDDKRCESALLELNSWIVDFRWTSSQHIVGANFSQKVCKLLSNEDELEKLACKVVNK